MSNGIIPGDGSPPARRESDLIIGYTIKEMFMQTQQAIGRVESLIASVSAAVAEKATSADLDALEQRVIHFERAEAVNASLIDDYKATRAMVTTHETTLQRQDAVKANQKATVALVLVLLSTAATLGALFLKAIGA